MQLIIHASHIYLLKAAAAAAEASEKAKAALETGDAELAAEAALECQKAAMASNDFIQNEIQKEQVRLYFATIYIAFMLVL
jgi:hypothetical protein